jgi:Mn-dependent DtxR family transcriptional regulator
MESDNIPQEVMRFILVSIPSIPYLEAMLMLRKETQQPWDCTRLARRLYVGEKPAADLLSELHAAGVLGVVGEDKPLYRYQPQTPELAQMIDRVAAVYARNLVEVTHLIHSKTSKNAQLFADAFIWRKDS